LALPYGEMWHYRIEIQASCDLLESVGDSKEPHAGFGMGLGALLCEKDSGASIKCTKDIILYKYDV
jgi:hypothetical protein